MEHIVGIDLHSNNGYYGIIDPDGKRVFQRRQANDLPAVLRMLEPYRDTVRSVVVESTYNWYWLVDGLMENGYRVKLANPAKFEKYNDMKYSDDKSDAFFLTELERLNILPTGYIYPREERPIRDLLRRRMFLVRHRTSLILSFQSLVSRETGRESMSARQISLLDAQRIEELFESEYVRVAARSYIISKRSHSWPVRYSCLKRRF
jgi:transposase